MIAYIFQKLSYDLKVLRHYLTGPDLLNTEHEDSKECMQAVDLLCETIFKVGGEFEISFAFNEDKWFALIEFSSAFVSLFFFAVVYYNKELQVHPMRLIMILAMVESGY